MTGEISREAIVAIVTKILENKEVESVTFNIRFKDGSSINVNKYN